MKNYKVIGTFKGECADSSITNENGLDITRAVWETVFESDEYKNAIDHGWYIGFLGHPEDPGCQDFQQACIVMKEGHIDDSGKVYGEFDLIDTPVGRVVKSFIDGGVTFGISVRGVGDIVDNSVDPETFVFRGFDLVTFPAFPEAIPEFSEIAASSDIETKKKYKKICSSVKRNLGSITSASTLDIMAHQFPEQSEVRKEIADRKSEVECESVDIEDENKDFVEPTLDDEKLNSLMKLYLAEKARADRLENQLKSSHSTRLSHDIKAYRKLAVIQRIIADQNYNLEQLQKSYRDDLAKLRSGKQSLVAANKQLKSKLSHERDTNLQYSAKVEASQKIAGDRESELKNVRRELSKTVAEVESYKDRISHLEAKIDEKDKQIAASAKLVEDYQDAYASLYSQATGLSLDNVSVTASTSVADLQKRITRSVQLESDSAIEPQLVDVDESYRDDDLVTA